MGQALEDAGDRVGSAASDPTEEEIADLFPALKDIRCVGRGGMGVVFKARQPALDRMIALKVLRRESANDPAFTERFRREARALARLNHPNIVAVHEFGEIGGLFHVVMEYVEGASLRELLRGGRLEPELALSIVPRLCDALQYAHDEGVVHRDIKPENILIDIRGRVKIADFGLARLLGPSAPDAVLTHTQDVMGTPHYMAPEQLEGGREIDHRADIYALGVVLYEMLTGSLPRGRFDPPSRTPAVDARLDEIVLRSLEHEPGRRYQTAREVKGDIEGVADRSATMPQPLSATESSRNIGCGTAGDPRAPRWWIRTGTVAQRMLRSLLWLGLAAAGLMLVSSRGSGGPESMRVEIGAPRPWLTVDRWSEGHAFAFHMVGFAVLMMAVVLAAGGLRRLPLVHRQICWRCGAGSDADADHCPDCGSETATAARETTGRHRLGAAIAWIPIAAFLAVAWSARPPGIAAKPGAVPEWEEGSPADSPILRAAGAGRIGEIRALLRAGADVNDKGPDGATALIVAARNGHVSAVLTLILLGAAVDDADAEGRTALMAAAEGGHAAVAKAMSDLATTLAVIRDEVRKSRSEDEDPGSLGIRMMRERIGGVDVALFDEIGLRVPDIEIDLAAQDLNGETALMKAAARGDAAFAMAVPAWEEENARDAAGRTAVMHAALHGRTEFVRALIGRHHRSHGTTAGSFGSHTLFHPAALAATDGEERTAIRIAEDEGHAELAALLRAEMRRAEEHYSRAIEAGGPWTYQWYRHRGWAREALGESAAAAADHAEADRREPLELRFDGALGPEENDAGEVEG